MLIILASLVIYFLIIFQIGHFLFGTRFLSFLRFSGKTEWYEFFWIGLVGLIAFLQMWSIFLPVDEKCLTLVVSITLATLVPALLRYRKYSIISIKKFVVKNKMFVGVCAFGLVGLMYYAWQPVNYFDTLLYHLNSVKWGNSFAVVPGLGNLHSRLGFNSSFFLLGSLIDNFYLRNASVHIALPLLISVLSFEIVWILLKSKNISLKIFVLVLSPFIVRGVAHETLAPSFSPDFALALIIVAASIELLKETQQSLFFAGLLSCLAATIKLSGMLFFVFMFLFVVFEFVRRIRKERIKIIFMIFVLSGILIVFYILRNIILSGWPFYPAPVLKVNLPWSMSDVWVRGMSDLIRAWAISPGPGWPNYMHIDFLKWFPVWFARNHIAVEVRMFFAGLILFVVLIALKIRGNKFLARIKHFIVLASVSLFSIAYVFWTAPDLRFGAIFIWIFFAAALTPFIVLIINKFHQSSVFLLVIWSTFLFTVSLPFRFPGIVLIRSIRKELPLTTKNVLFNQSEPKNQFSVFIPEDGELCGNSDLPCTPELNNIREIVPGDISKGFVTKY